MFFNAEQELVAVPEKPRTNINIGTKIPPLARQASPQSPVIVKLPEAILQQTQLLHFRPNGGILRRNAFQHVAQRLNLQPQLMQRLWRTESRGATAHRAHRRVKAAPAECAALAKRSP